MMKQVFQVCDQQWRGIGVIPRSGYALRPEFRTFDAAARFDVGGITAQESPLCIAGEILQGNKKPQQCAAFGVQCTPERPLGAPMVSSEGACAAYYRYGRTA
jgi:hydrogenase expression/formation protein HypD